MIVSTGMVRICLVPRARNAVGMSEALIRSLPAQLRKMPR